MQKFNVFSARQSREGAFAGALSYQLLQVAEVSLEAACWSSLKSFAIWWKHWVLWKSKQHGHEGEDSADRTQEES